MRYDNYIGGVWKKPAGGEYTPNRNPHDPEEILGHFAASTAEDVREAVSSAKKAFPSWKKLSFPERAAYLKKAAEIIRGKAGQIARDLTREEGKTLVEASGETLRAVSILEFFASEAFQPVGEVIPSVSEQTFLFTKREPLGAVGLITPWNFPIAIPVWKMAPALLYGNTVVIKPAELTPMSVYHVIDAFHKAGIPKGVVNCVFGTGSVVGSEIVQNSEIKAISFTGSNLVGRSIQERAAMQGKKVQLELGGKNPLIVLDDADLDKAVEIAISGAFRSTGQKCTATSRIMVDAKVYKAFRDRLVKKTKMLKVGNPLKPDTFMGPCASRGQCDQVLEMIEAGKKEADLLVGGEIPPKPELVRGFYVQPSIFENVPRDARIAREEIFGPVISLFQVNGYDEAIELANDTFFGLSASICTNNLTLARRFVDEIEAGMVHINSETAGAEPQAPFGGGKGSGNGSREQGKAAAEFYTQLKTVYMDPI
ncbi:aldehyde dehydrogenase family protein [Thermoactinomyces mirandus]|uniref:Aldehyde dehydrogenase family protein n=1 Tax=Thermoactinomyces mirandus TaxID=2756294 RepID=A0A7W1XSA3_9BACL|nr:aldehyde dehydrogenase family protein [Thermoactinomyces mirandus]MBA4602250.1 aldehyde dehydrogenase family protein [Thermoactinomyces mirandus]